MVEVMKIMVTSSTSPRHCCTQCPDPAEAPADPQLCQRLLDTHGQVWVRLLWGHGSFPLGPGAHQVLFVPSKRVRHRDCQTPVPFLLFRKFKFGWCCTKGRVTPEFPSAEFAWGLTLLPSSLPSPVHFLVMLTQSSS